LKIIISVFDGVYGRPAAGVGVSVLCEPVGEPSVRSAGLTDSRGNFTAKGEDMPHGQHCTVRLDVDAYFGSLGIVAGYKQTALVARIIDGEREHRIVTVITPFAHTTWHVR
jgi:hypothetical protein